MTTARHSYRTQVVIRALLAQFAEGFPDNGDGTAFMGFEHENMVEIAMVTLDKETVRSVLASADDTWAGMSAIGYLKAAASIGFETLSSILTVDGVLFVLGREWDANVLSVSTKQGIVYDAAIEFGLVDPMSADGKGIQGPSSPRNVTSGLKTMCAFWEHGYLAVPSFWWSRDGSRSDDAPRLGLFSLKEKELHMRDRGKLALTGPAEIRKDRAMTLPASWRHRLAIDCRRTRLDAIALWKSEAVIRASNDGTPLP